jgi:hypothetical protein
LVSRVPLPFIEVGESNSHVETVSTVLRFAPKPIRVEAADRALSHLDDYELQGWAPPYRTYKVLW